MSAAKARWLLAVAVATIVLCAVGFEVVFSKTQWYFSRTTLSTYSYREWPLGFRTDERRNESALEAFLKKDVGDKIRYDWAHGTQGYNVYGDAILFGDPGINAAYRLKGNRLAVWIQKHKPEEVRAFYELLVSNDYDAIEARVQEIEAEIPQL